MLSIASAPGEPVRLGMRVGVEPSSFKRAAVEAPIGSTLAATGVWGDFVLPREERPVLLVAGGIGITPFLSMIAAHDDRPMTLVYGVPGRSVPFREELEAAGVPVLLVSPETPDDLPDGWTHLRASTITADAIAEHVGDLQEHVAYVSGPPRMVSAVATSLRGRVTAVRTDHFDGY
jgi:ferredoxin-NADP reductase